MSNRRALRFESMTQLEFTVCVQVELYLNVFPERKRGDNQTRLC